jgi:AcrR family transcriptional regulator
VDRSLRRDGSAVGRGERSDAVESRRRILAAARELIEEKGVDAASMHEIGRRAGVGQGTLYRHYGHKGALCSELLRERVEEFREEVGTEDEEALRKVAWLLERLALFNEENAPLLGAIRDASGGGRRMELYKSPFYGWLRVTVGALLSRAVERGETRPDLDVDCVADFSLAALNVDLYLFQRRELEMDVGASCGRCVSVSTGFVRAASAS